MLYSTVVVDIVGPDMVAKAEGWALTPCGVILLFMLPLSGKLIPAHCRNYIAMQSQKAVSAYISSKQILPFIFTEHNNTPQLHHSHRLPAPLI